MKNESGSYRPKIKSALLSLGAVSLLFFSLAFACGDSGDDGGGGDNPVVDQNMADSGAPSEATVKAWVKDYEDEINPVGGISSPMSISLTFGQIQYGSPRTANEGDRMRHVRSAQLYPVIVDYIVNGKYSDGNHPTRKKWKYEFYVNTEGTWSAFNYGPEK